MTGTMLAEFTKYPKLLQMMYMFSGAMCSVSLVRCVLKGHTANSVVEWCTGL